MKGEIKQSSGGFETERKRTKIKTNQA